MELTATSTATIDAWTLAVAVGGGGGQGGGFSIAGAGSGSGNSIQNTVKRKSSTAAPSPPRAAGSVTLSATDTSKIIADAGGVGLAGAGGEGGGVSISAGISIAENELGNVVQTVVDRSTVTSATDVTLCATSSGTIDALTWGGAVSLSGGAGGGVSAAGAGAEASNWIHNSVTAAIQNASTVQAKAGYVKLTATDTATITAKAIGGSVALAGGAGGAVTIPIGAAVADNVIENVVKACINNSVVSAVDNATDSPTGHVTLQAQSTSTITALSVAASLSVAVAPAGLSFSGAGADSTNTMASQIIACIDNNSGVTATGKVDLSAIDTPTTTADVGSGALSVGVAGASVGLSLSDNTINDTVKVHVGHASVSAGGDINITSTSTGKIDALTVATSFAVTVGGAEAGGVANATITTSVEAYAGGAATLAAGKDVAIKAISNHSATADSHGISGGFIAAGASIATVSANGTVKAHVDGPVDQAQNVRVRAKATNTATATTFALAGGILGGEGSSAAAEVAPTVEAFVGDNADIKSTSDVDILAMSAADANADALGVLAAGVAIGRSKALADVSPQIHAYVGQHANVVAGQDITLRSLHNLDEQGTALDKDATADASSSGGGLLVLPGAEVHAVTKPQTTTSAKDGATMRAMGGGIVIAAQSASQAMPEGTGKTGGLVGKGKITSHTELTNRTQASVGRNVQITAHQDFSLLAKSTNTANALATGGSGGVVDLSKAATDVSVDDQTTSEVGDGSNIVAGTVLSVVAEMETTAHTHCDVDTRGLGVNADSAATVTSIGSTTTTVGAAALRAGTVIVRADVTTLDIGSGSTGPMAESFGGALGADSDARTTVTTTTTAAVTVEGGARITGVNQVDVVAAQKKLDTVAKTRARTVGSRGDTDAAAANTMTVDTLVTAEADAQITTRKLLVEVSAPELLTFSSVATSLGAVIDPGTEPESSDLHMNRAIDFHSKVIVPGDSPWLNIDANGKVTTSSGVTFTTNDSQADSPVVVDGIYNTSTLGGSLEIKVPAFTPTGSPDATVTDTAAITGSAEIEFQTGFESVRITNQSTRQLQITDITSQNNTGQENQNIEVSPLDENEPKFSWSTITTPGNTPIVIANTNDDGGDILLRGFVNNPYGTVQIHTAGGDISGNSTAKIDTTELTLHAPQGRIGTSDGPIQTSATMLNGLAHEDIYVDVTAGNLRLDAVRSVAGPVRLTAGGSILDGTTGDSVSIDAPTIELVALSGSVGAVADPLEIDVSTGSLTVWAAHDIVLVDVAGALRVADIVSRAGDIHLATADAPGTGQDIYLDDGAEVRAELGSVKLSVGDALRAAAGSRITAAGAVTIIGNSVAADAAGAVIELSGVIRATSVQITGSDRNDVMSLTSVRAETPVTIDAGAGSDIIRVGSAATADSNVGGRIDTVIGHLTVRGGADGDTLHIDDSGHDRATSGKLTSTTVTWPGRSGVITYEGIEDLRMALGSSADSLTVAGTSSGTTVSVDAGAGDDTLELRGGDHTLNAIAGTLVLLGGPGSNRLRAFDTLDDGPNSGTLSGTQLTGLGMAGTVQYGDMAELLIELGQGDDTFTVQGTRASTEVRGHAGNDELVVSGDLGQITKPLWFRGGTASGDTDTLRVSGCASPPISSSTKRPIHGMCRATRWG